MHSCTPLSTTAMPKNNLISLPLPSGRKRKPVLNEVLCMPGKASQHIPIHLKVRQDMIAERNLSDSARNVYNG
eukprot:m.273610 g.273610  ORF g.273610 m.273610 type:complete len:73 (-) comp46614_c0_seq1:66-284(-)